MSIDDLAMPIEVSDYESADHFVGRDAQAALLDDAIASGDAAYLIHALGVIAKAYGMAALARDTGMKRQQLYAVLGKGGNPTLATITKLLAALGLRLRIEAASAA